MADWTDNAACKGMDAAIFYPDRRDSGDRFQRFAAPAKAVCASCPVTQQCLDFALRTNETEGIWAGLTERERRSLKRRRKAVTKQLEAAQ